MELTKDERADMESLAERMTGWIEDLESAIAYAEKNGQHAATRVTMAADLARLRREERCFRVKVLGEERVCDACGEPLPSEYVGQLCVQCAAEAAESEAAEQRMETDREDRHG